MKNVPATVVAIALLVASALTAARADDVIPFTQPDGGLIAIQASLDGQPPVPFLVDLGAGVNILSPDATRRVYVAPGGYYTGFRMLGERVDLSLGTVGSIAVGGFLVDGAQVGIWDGLRGSGFAGALSATAFRNVTATFDFPNHQITIDDQQSFAQRRMGGIRVPIVLRDDLDTSLTLFARFDFGHGQSGLCEIDTGSQGFYLNQRYEPKLGVTGATATLASLALDGAPSTAIAQPKVHFANLIYDCNVGNDFWRGRTFTLDVPERALYIPKS